MSEFRKANTDHPYFITMTVVRWIDLFTKSSYCDIIIKNLNFCRKEKDLKVFSYVIMPNHIHLILQNLDSKLNYILRDFKSYCAKEIIQKLKDERSTRSRWMLRLMKEEASKYRKDQNFMIWQRTNHPTELSWNAIYDQKEEYIHANPVAAGLVTNPEFWTYSSACPMSPLKVDPS